MFLRLILLVAVLTISTRAQLIHEDFDGSALPPVWIAIPLSGSITLSGGAVHLTSPTSPAGVLYSFPYLGVAPGVVTVPTPVWVVEARIAWSLNPSLGY